MAWVTKGTGLNYNSNTGFSNLVGGRTNKVLVSKIMCRRCRICINAERKKSQFVSTSASSITKGLQMRCKHNPFWKWQSMLPTRRN